MTLPLYTTGVRRSATDQLPTIFPPRSGETSRLAGLTKNRHSTIASISQAPSRSDGAPYNRTFRKESSYATPKRPQKTNNRPEDAPTFLPVPAGLSANMATRRNRVALKVLPRRSSCYATAPRLPPSAEFIASLTCESPMNAQCVCLRFCNEHHKERQ